MGLCGKGAGWEPPLEAGEMEKPEIHKSDNPTDPDPGSTWANNSHIADLSHAHIPFFSKSRYSELVSSFIVGDAIISDRW